MRSLRQSLDDAGLTGRFSLREHFETHPKMLGETLRVLGLPAARLDLESREELWEKSVQDAQGIACIDRDTSVITVAKKLFSTRSRDSRYDRIVATHDVAHFSDQTKPRLSGCDHFSDPDHRNGLTFFVFEVDGTPGALFACDLGFQVVGFTELEDGASNSCCAFHPWNGLLYVKDNDFPGQKLRAYDVAEYFRRHQSGSTVDWGKSVEIERNEKADLSFRDTAGEPMKLLGDIQGMAFSPNGRLYVTHWTSYENAVGKFFISYLSIYSSLTGRRMWFSDEIDFEGDGDEIEGISLEVSRGEIYFVQADNDLDVDELYLHRFRLPPELVQEGGGRVEDVI